MKKLKTGILLLLVTTLIISCGKTNNNDPLSLFSEITKNQSPNTLSKKEMKNGIQN